MATLIAKIACTNGLPALIAQEQESAEEINQYLQEVIDQAISTVEDLAQQISEQERLRGRASNAAMAVRSACLTARTNLDSQAATNALMKPMPRPIAQVDPQGGTSNYRRRSFRKEERSTLPIVCALCSNKQCE